MNEIGFERKIGYSFVGLMAGNVAAAVALLLIYLLPRLGLLPGLSRVWNPTTPILFFFIAMVSMLGWALIGLPVVLLLRAESAADFYWPAAALIGGVLGVLGMLLFWWCWTAAWEPSPMLRRCGRCGRSLPMLR